MDVGEAIKRPFSDIKKLAIGCVLNIIPIVGLLSTGYAAEAGKLSIAKKKNLPEWQNWGDLFIKGLLLAIIAIIWTLPVLLIMGVILGGAIVGLIMGDVSGIVAALTAAGGMFMIALLLGLVIIYLAPLAAFGFIATGKFGEAFNFGVIFKKAFKGDYFVAWILSLIISIVLAAIGGMIPVINLVTGPILNFIATLISVTLIGEVYKSL